MKDSKVEEILNIPPPLPLERQDAVCQRRSVGSLEVPRSLVGATIFVLELNDSDCHSESLCLL
jgi:hypothetical protein